MSFMHHRDFALMSLRHHLHARRLGLWILRIAAWA